MHESELDPSGHKISPAAQVDLHVEHVEDEEAPNQGEYVPAAQAEQLTVILLSPYDPGPHVKYHKSSSTPLSLPQTTTVLLRATARLLVCPVFPSNNQLGGLPALVSTSTSVHDCAPGPAKFRSSPVSRSTHRA